MYVGATTMKTCFEFLFLHVSMPSSTPHFSSKKNQVNALCTLKFNIYSVSTIITNAKQILFLGRKS
jgi:hypothetical protein